MLETNPVPKSLPLSWLKTFPHLKISGLISSEVTEILTPEAVEFLVKLHDKFDARRIELLQARKQRAQDIASGKLPQFLPETRQVRESQWQVAKAPHDLNDRRVEITGPVERKMMINALNSGAKVFMADIEDATSPTWQNVIQGQANLKQAVSCTLSFVSPDGKEYKLGPQLATLVVRPRGWHLHESHVMIAGRPLSGSLFDFGLYFFHNARTLLSKGSGPYFYLPKLESHLEARLWNDVFNFAQDYLQIPRGTIRATVLIETILAAFEMEEILFELRDHAAGLNAGRWDYLFSIIKKFVHQKDVIFPDRAQLTMTVPFMRAYTDLLVKTCHRRGAHAIGGMAAFIPSRKDAEVNAMAFQKVTEDKRREAGDGFDGTWVAHPDLVPVAKTVFDNVLGEKPHQKPKLREDVKVSAEDLYPKSVVGGKVTKAGLQNNISVALQYIESWLQGFGAVAINNLMEDAATAEISRAELWQWVHFNATLEDGTPITSLLFQRELDTEFARLGGSKTGRLLDAKNLLANLVFAETFPEFLTLPAYEVLESTLKT